MTQAFNGEQMNVFVRWPKTFALGGMSKSESNRTKHENTQAIALNM